MGPRSGQGLNPRGTPREVPVLQARPTQASPRLQSSWLGRAVSLGVRAADLMFSTSSHVAGLVCMEHAGLAGRPVLALLNLAMANVGKC